MCRVFAEKSSITGNKMGKICVKMPILRPGSMSSYSFRCHAMILSSIDVTATTLDVKQSFSILSCSLDPSISFQPCRGRTFPSLPPCIYTYCV
jgi:hypothetical protein